MKVVADKSWIGLANETLNIARSGAVAAGAMLDPAITMNASSKDVTRIRHAPTILQYSHQST
ncbi:MAG TPA: hypothetical protein VK638_20675 [Edaphobacter sp.]|nr:hypothetical protein [Edaphobacter sp.]